MDHLQVELLSALADGELDGSTSRKAQAHLTECAECATALASFGRLDRAIAVPAPIRCAASRALRSALLDGELVAEEASVARAHLSTCQACRTEQALWASSDAAIRGLAAVSPSPALDARVMRLAGAARGRTALTGPRTLGRVALRGALAGSIVLAIVLGLLPSGPTGPEQAAEAPPADRAFVAGVQQFVLYAPTNTLYVLQPAASAVDAVDGTSHALRTRIHVGGRPTALALNEAASRIVVLDAGQRSVVEIDARDDRVVATTTLPLSGRPTSVAVDQNTGRIIVAAIPDPPLGGPAPTPTIGAPPAAGSVSVLDPTTKKIETFKSVEVAPQLVVTERDGKHTLLVSTGGTTLVDDAYRTVRTLPGGVAAAFAARGPTIAVLSAEAGSAVLHFSGDDAPGPLRLTGVPLAVTSVPGVGFAVLLGSGSGNGRIVVVDEAGRAVGSSDVAETGRDLVYEAASRRFTVVGGGKVASAALPSGLVAAGTPPPELSPLASASPPQSARPPAGPSQSPAPSPQTTSPSPSSSALPSPSVSVAPTNGVAIASPVVLPPGVPANAKRVTEDLYRIDLGGRTPVLTAATLRRVWFTDSANGLNALDMASGAVFTLAHFPQGADISAVAVGATQVYAIDAGRGRLFTFDIATERLTSRDLPFLRGGAVMAVAGDGRLWIGIEASAQLVSFDPRTERTEIVHTTMQRIVAIAIDNSAKVWFSDGARLVGNYDLITRRVTQLLVPGKGAARILLPGTAGLIWLGTTAGEVIAASDVDATARIVRVTGLPIARLTVDTRGVIWYLTPAPAGQGGYLYGPAVGDRAPYLVPGPAGGLDFGLGNLAWIADVEGGFFIGLGSTR